MAVLFCIFSGLGGMPSEVEPSTMNNITSPTTLPKNTAAHPPPDSTGTGQKGSPGKSIGGNGGGGRGSPRGGRGSPRGSASPVGSNTPTGTGRRSPHSQTSPSKDGLKSPASGKANGESHSGEYQIFLMYYTFAIIQEESPGLITLPVEFSVNPYAMMMTTPMW